MTPPPRRQRRAGKNARKEQVTAPSKTALAGDHHGLKKHERPRQVQQNQVPEQGLFQQKYRPCAHLTTGWKKP